VEKVSGLQKGKYGSTGEGGRLGQDMCKTVSEGNLAEVWEVMSALCGILIAVYQDMLDGKFGITGYTTGRSPID
jgi:hypothetical protein